MWHWWGGRTPVGVISKVFELFVLISVLFFCTVLQYFFFFKKICIIVTLFIWMSFLMVQFGFEQKARGQTLRCPDCGFVCFTANMNYVWWRLCCNVSELLKHVLQALIVQFMYSLSCCCFLCVRGFWLKGLSNAELVVSLLFKCCLSDFTDLTHQHDWRVIKSIHTYWIIWLDAVPLVYSIHSQTRCSSRMRHRAALLDLCWDSRSARGDNEVINPDVYLSEP